MYIQEVRGRQVLDSRGQPTIEVDVILESGLKGRAIAPSGASTGSHEALELRDRDCQTYCGNGVLKAVKCVRNEISPALRGMNVFDQTLIDQLLIEIDGTSTKSRLGANTILAVSLSVAVAAAKVKARPLYEHISDLFRLNEGMGTNLSLPLPMVNILSGGLHAGRQIDIQDFLFVPIGSGSYSEAMQKVFKVYHASKELLHERGYEVNLVADEGGFGPKLGSNEEALEILTACIEKAGMSLGTSGAIAVDVAATHFFSNGTYKLSSDNRNLSMADMVRLLESWASRYPIISIEDGMAEDDWEGWKNLTNTLEDRMQLVGDDLFATSPSRIERGISSSVANSVLIKLNQIGTLTETLGAIRLSKKSGYHTIISARSGETEDTFIADLAVGTNAGQIKIGSINRSERLAKYNQLFRIEEEIGTDKLAVPFG